MSRPLVSEGIAVAASERERWATHECGYYPTGEACLSPCMLEGDMS